VTEFVAVLVGFARALRVAGVRAGTGDAEVFCAAVACLNPADLVDLYWGGRCALVTRHADIPVYDEVFRQYFLGTDAPAAAVAELRAVSTAGTFVVPSVEPGTVESEQEALGLSASAVDIQRNRSFAECTPEELVALRRILARLRLTPPTRRTRRLGPARLGRVLDLRRMVRASLRTQGEPVSLRWRQRRVRPRRLVLLLDVSGSMAEYSRALLQFAHTTGGAGGGVLLRHPADVPDACAANPVGGRCPAVSRKAHDRLGRWHEDRRLPRRVRPRLGETRHVPGCDGGHLLGRSRPR
jgi:uncharacterized protein